mgnify:CR=1 FL=1
MSVSHLANHVEYRSECLFMAVFLWQWCGPVFIKTNMWLSSTQNSHIGKSHTKETTISKRSNRRLQERHCCSIRIKIDHIEESLLSPHLIQEVYCIHSVGFVFFFSNIIMLHVFLDKLHCHGIPIIAYKLFNAINFF